MTRNNAKKISEQKLRPITVDEMEKAEIVILKLAQNDSFSDEIAALKEVLAENHSDPRAKISSEKKKVKTISSLFRLDPFIDRNGLLRVGGRLSKSRSLPEDLMHPVILPKKSHITTLVIRHSHEKVAHAGRGNTLNELRSKYWITNANSAVRHYISKCVRCRRLRAVVGEQMMADLPKDRVSPAPPFTYCAVDYFGPYFVKEGRKQLKRYGVLFTCLASRAIHLETAISLESDSFICALRRFVARRGPVRQMRSDRGTNFIGTERELKSALEEMDHKRPQEISSKEFNADWLINWNRNPPAASHMGGRWRRVQYMANIFWTRWKREYLQTLQARTKWNQPKRNIEIGDIVLIKDENTARNDWPMARVVNVRQDSKGFVRSATLKLSFSTQERPIDKLVLLMENDETLDGRNFRWTKH
ncbi:uncharacterized protein LOC110248158 [Paramuricea clavata]|uniref:Uncharacterized protein LOC110248158 n=1 Tax=Paramuricea clavata TaxID=317549 RepID=A0A7D9EHI9_PARCT|nr:uncharacterized protein LOC110248158 [Paramuricea clavata]